jgi:hypothetical protein
MLSHPKTNRSLVQQVRAESARLVLFFLLTAVFTAIALAQDAPPPPPPPPPPPSQSGPAGQPQGYPQGQPQDYPQGQPPGYPQGQPQGYPQGQPQGYPPGQPQGYPQGQPQGPPPMLAPQQLDPLVSRIALYPDPLLAQILTGATFPEEIPDAANWADEHSGLRADALANAITGDNLPWDPSVLALLPFPSVLDMMAQDPGWTQSLGNAVLVQRPDVMDAVQRMRQQAYNFGYLRPTPYNNVINSGGYVQIVPVNPAYIYPPIYNPAIVFVAPRPGFVITAGIHFGPSVVIGPAFVPFGWYGAGIGWGAHAILVGGAPWGRTWANRGYYAHPYTGAYRPRPGPRVENHPAERRPPPAEHHPYNH